MTGYRAGRPKVKFGAAPALLLAVLVGGVPALAAGSATTQPAPATIGPVAPGTAGPEVAAQVWEPLAYGDARIKTPAEATPSGSWPVVYPGSDMCGPNGAEGVVLLGTFGASSWCGSNTTAPAGQPPPANVVRFGPFHRRGTVHAERPLRRSSTGSACTRVCSTGRSRGPSTPPLRSGSSSWRPGRWLGVWSVHWRRRSAPWSSRTGPARARPASWRSMSFAGLHFAVPAGWPLTRTSYAFGCAPTDIAFSAPSVTLATDTNTERLPCPYMFPARPGTNGVQIDQGSLTAPNTVPQGAPPMLVNGLEMYVDEAYPFSSLVVEVELPGRAMPVRVTIGLGTAGTAGAVLRSITGTS